MLFTSTWFAPCFVRILHVHIYVNSTSKWSTVTVRFVKQKSFLGYLDTTLYNVSCLHVLHAATMSIIGVRTSHRRIFCSALPRFGMHEVLNHDQCGIYMFASLSRDTLLEDTAFLTLTWMVAGGEGVVTIYSGGSHMYLEFRIDIWLRSRCLRRFGFSWRTKWIDQTGKENTEFRKPSVGTLETQ